MKVKEFETGKSHVMKAVNTLIQNGYSALDVENIVNAVLIQLKDEVRVQAINEATAELAEATEETVTPEEVITDVEAQE